MRDNAIEDKIVKLLEKSETCSNAAHQANHVTGQYVMVNPRKQAWATRFYRQACDVASANDIPAARLLEIHQFVITRQQALQSMLEVVTTK